MPGSNSIRRTIPDFYREDPATDVRVATYLDGLSKDIHGNEERRQVDHYIRAVLQAMGIDVIEIAASALDDPEMLRLHERAIARALRGRTRHRDDRDGEKNS
ncbi:MAG TPA: hypothetical protein EYP43_03670 [Thermoplasmata archaeon]|nr:hypothetical protein [Thermoplasmata archaeon]